MDSIDGDPDRVLGTFTAMESTVVVEAFNGFDVLVVDAAEPVLRILAGNLGRGAVVVLGGFEMLMRAASWLREGKRPAGGALEVSVGLGGSELIVVTEKEPNCKHRQLIIDASTSI